MPANVALTALRSTDPQTKLLLLRLGDDLERTKALELGSDNRVEIHYLGMEQNEGLELVEAALGRVGEALGIDSKDYFAFGAAS